jgi:predicted membrane-bound spermidine synthase
MSVAFFLSGAAGLIFEIVWFYRCGLLLGNTVWATSIVLSSFMGGLALGNGLVGWFGARIRHFLTLYASLEAIVAVTGVGLTYLLGALPGVLAPATQSFLDTRWLVNVVRLATVFPLLLLPTTAMGATFPVVVGEQSQSEGRFGAALGRLYGWNTLGAVLGAVSVELFLIGRVGVIGSAWVAALLNGGAAGIALWMAFRNQVVPRAATSVPPVERIDTQNNLWPAWRLLSCAALMGGAFMALEVVWLRFFSMFVVASTLAVSMMLAVVLAAIALGGLVGSRWMLRQPDAVNYVPHVAFATACTVVTSYGTFQFLTDPTWAAEWHRMLWFAVVLTSSTALLSGIAFVLLGAALKRRVNDPAAPTAGWLTLANTAGGMLGPLVAAFALLPRAGMERSFFALALCYVVIGVIALPGSLGRARSSYPRRALVASATAAGAALLMFPFGVMQAAYFPRAIAAFSDDGARVVATRQGVSETIQLMAKSWLDKPLYYRLVTNGFSMSGTHMSAKRYMRYFAYWPLMLHDGPLHQALIVCYGVGVTTAAVESIAAIQSIDVVEISPDIPAMSNIIYKPDEHPLHDPRVHLHVEDGRFFLQATRRRFDLITGEPPPPLTPGAVSLYTRDYFQLMHDHLEEGGIVTYWLPAARRGEYDEKAIIAAFCAVFDDCSLWNGTVFDWMLVGTRHLTGPRSESAFAAAWKDPTVWPRLREIGFEVPEEIGATFLGDSEDLRHLTDGALPITDDYPKRLRPAATRLSLLSTPPDAERHVAQSLAAVVDTDHARLAFQRSALIHRLWPETLARETIPFFDIQRIINHIMREGPRPLASIEEIHQLLTKTTLRRVPLWELGSDDAQQEVAETGNDGSGMVEYVVGIRALVARQYPAAARSFADAERRGLRLPTLRPLLVYALCMGGELDAARQLARRANVADADELHFWVWLEATFGVRAAVS